MVQDLMNNNQIVVQEDAVFDAAGLVCSTWSLMQYPFTRTHSIQEAYEEPFFGRFEDDEYNIDTSAYNAHLSTSSFDSLESAYSTMPTVDFLEHQDYLDSVSLDVSQHSEIYMEETNPELTPMSVTVNSLIKFQPFEGTSEDEKQEDSEDEEYEEKKKTPAKVARTPEPKISKKKQACGRKKMTAIASVAVTEDPNVQCSCCLSGCENSVTNRLRFSLRREHMFKLAYLQKGWNKVCSMNTI
jgi:hypothetical protein